MYGADPYLAERSMALQSDVVRREVQRLGPVSLSTAARSLARRLSLPLVALGGRLVRIGLSPYEPGTGANSGQNASPGGAPA